MTLELKGASVFTAQTAKCPFGATMDLSKTPNLNKIAVKIKWRGDDCDLIAVGLDKDGAVVVVDDKGSFLTKESVSAKGEKVIVPKYMIHYQNEQETGINYQGDCISTNDSLEEEVMVIDASALPTDNVYGWGFILSSHAERGEAITFSDIKDISVEIINADTNEVVYETAIDQVSQVQDQTALLFAKIQKEGSSFNYTTSAQGLGSEPHGALNVYKSFYGVK